MDGTRSVPSPYGSNRQTFFRWCFGGMSAFASGSVPAFARGADAGVSLSEFWEVLNADCGNMPASQDDLIARSDFLGGDGEEEEGEAEEFSTPPLTQQDPQRQGQSQRGQAGDGEEGFTMCSMPFTQTPPSSPSPPSSTSSDSWERVPAKPRKPRICTRKVRGGAKIRTPTPSPRPSPELDPIRTTTPSPRPSPELDPIRTPTPSPRPSPELDPLARIVLMIPTAPLQTTGDEDILELARRRGIF